MDFVYSIERPSQSRGGLIECKRARLRARHDALLRGPLQSDEAPRMVPVHSKNSPDFPHASGGHTCNAPVTLLS